MMTTDLPHEYSAGKDAEPESLGYEGGPTVHLSVTEGPMAGQKFVFDTHDTFIFGRDASCRASLPDDSFVSRHHFLLEVNPPEASIRDLGSMNGTCINGVRYGGPQQPCRPGEVFKPCDEGVDLWVGDTIQVGETVFVVSSAGPGDGDRGVPCQACGKDIKGRVRGGGGAEKLCEACRRTELARPVTSPDSRKAGASEDGKGDWLSIPGYTLLRELGHGGMGTVYLAKRDRDGESVAIKVMLSKVAIDEKRRQWFLREMELLDYLVHPNIVTFVERGSTGNAFFFVMEHCESGDVKKLVESRGGRLQTRTVVPIMMQSLKGLAHAHDEHVVHRDIKPPNLLLFGQMGSWQVKVSDFGLAKNFDKAGLSGMTATGVIGGTFAFMPREQMTDYRYVKPVSDVWSIAATFYFMLTGQLPREGRPGQGHLQVILDGRVVPIEERLPNAPAPFAAVFGKALAIDPAERFETAGEFRSALRETLLKK